MGTTARYAKFRTNPKDVNIHLARDTVLSASFNDYVKLVGCYTRIY